MRQISNLSFPMFSFTSDKLCGAEIFELYVAGGFEQRSIALGYGDNVCHLHYTFLDAWIGGLGVTWVVRGVYGHSFQEILEMYVSGGVRVRRPWLRR